MTRSTNGPTPASGIARELVRSTTNDEQLEISTTKHYEPSATDSSATYTAASNTTAPTTNTPRGATEPNPTNSQLDSYRSWGVSSQAS